MKTVSGNEFRQMYGVMGESQFQDKEREQSLFSAIKSDLSRRGEQNTNLLDEGGTSPLDNFTTGLGVAANTAGGVADVAGETFSRIPGVGGVLKKVGSALKGGFDAVTDRLGSTKFFGEASAGLEPNSPLEKGLGAASSAGEIATNILGSDVGSGAVKGGMGVASKVPSSVSKVIPTERLASATQYAKGAIRDVTPTTQGLIDHNLAKALDLTPGDLSNIEKSTGNAVGPWLSGNNLIGTNKVTTQGLINGFFKTNYDGVRAEIGKVKTMYSPEDVPRFRDVLTSLATETEGKLGLESTNRIVQNLLKKPEVSLMDVQKAKELLDDYYSLYKATGDVKQGVEKQGLSNVRSELKSFIESEVAKNTGADIRLMNNNVATAKSIADAIETRTPRGLTRANLTTRDIMMGLGLTYFTTPLVGIAAVLFKKVATSPTIRLRLARYLDSLSDGQRRKISESLKEGVVPKELKAISGPLVE